MSNPQLILASGSPRRRWLLAEAGVSFTVVVPQLDEVWEDDAPENTVRLAVEKAQWTAELLRSNPPPEVSESASRFLLAADTIVLLAGRILGKPQDTADAVDDRLVEQSFDLFSHPRRPVRRTCLLTPSPIPRQPSRWQDKCPESARFAKTLADFTFA